MQKTISLFIAIVLILATLGIVMLYSASSVKYDDATYFVKRQLIWLALSAFAAFMTTRLDYQIYRRFAIPMAAVCVLLLILVRIPGIGLCINGSFRWLQVGPIRFQPSEFSKIAIIALFAWWLARNQRRIDELKRGILIPFLMLGCFAVPIIAEPDFGTTMLVSAVCVMMMFVGGVTIAPLLVTGVAGMMGIAVLLFQNPERMARILAFLNPQEHAQDKAWQLVNSLQAFASGGFGGVSLGNSMQKYHYLPEAHTDFILPIIGEELGLLATLGVVLLFMMLFVLGIRIAWKAKDDFGRFLAMGITLLITLQALINFAVVTGCVPTKGLALPFISYGGSSLIVSGVMVGILVNIAQSGSKVSAGKGRNLFKDRTRKV